jgi:hypothetical protein
VLIDIESGSKQSQTLSLFCKMKYIISLPAYAKIVLHALKYPFLSVTGVLLGHYKDRNPQTSDVVEITDSVPLFHGIVLSPMLEVAMIQVL